MKKILLILLLLICLSACEKKQDESIVPEYPYEIVSEHVDMSSYEGISSTGHNFRVISPQELINVIDNKSSGVFYFGTRSCGCCQRVVRYLNDVALELDVTVYYIDAYSEKYPILDTEYAEKLRAYMDEILGTDEEGKKTFLTPQVFSVVNGKYYGSQICMDGYTLDVVPTEQQLEKFKDSYRNIMKPFTK